MISGDLFGKTFWSPFKLKTLGRLKGPHLGFFIKRKSLGKVWLNIYTGSVQSDMFVQCLPNVPLFQSVNHPEVPPSKHSGLCDWQTCSAELECVTITRLSWISLLCVSLRNEGKNRPVRGIWDRHNAALVFEITSLTQGLYSETWNYLQCPP